MSQISTFYKSLLSSLALVVSDEKVIETAKSITDEIPFGKLAINAGTAIVAGLAPEVTGHFACQLSYEKLKKRFAHPNELNHYLSEAIKPALIQAYEFIERIYIANLKEQFQDDELVDEVKSHLKTLKGDLKHWLKDEILETDFLDKPQDALQAITTRMFLYGGYDQNNSKWTDLRQYFSENLYAWFDLAFKEALYDNDNALKSFQKYLLEEIREQNRNNEILILAVQQEIRALATNQKGSSTDGLKDFFKDEIKRIYEKLNVIHKDVKFIIRQIEKLRKEFLEKITPTQKTTKTLTPIPTRGTFIGRELDLQRLIDTLESANQVVLVNGLGGIGKTTLAKAYIQAKYSDFDNIAWINVLTNDIKQAFVNATYYHQALQNAKLTQGDTETRFGAIIQVLHQLGGSKNLLVIDNAEDDIQQIDLPPTLNWKILLTSREHLAGYKTLPLDELSPQDALLLFKTYYTGEAKDQTLNDLLRAINYHTLVVELLAKTLENSDDYFDLEELAEKLKNRKLDDKKLQRAIETEHWDAKTTALFAHLSVTFDLGKIKENTYTIWVLKQFAALPPEPQPIKQLREWLKIDDFFREEFDTAIKILHSKGWLRKTKNPKNETCYAIHRLVQDMVQYQHPIVFEDIAVLVDTFKNLLDFDTSTNFATKFQYLAPAEQILNSLPKDFENNEIGTLMNNLGETFRNFADYNKAKYYLEKTIIFSEKEFGIEHSETAISYSNLAIVLQDLGDYPGAKALLEKALISDEKNFGSEHPSTARTYSNLALVLKDLGDFEGAKDLLEKALISVEKNFGAEHPTTAIRYSNLALVLQDLGDYAGAKALLEKALISDEKNFGTEHPSTARTYSNLALVLQDLGDYAGAKALLEKALISDEKNFGSEHPTTAIHYSNLALVLKDLGDFEGAKELLEKALISDEKNFGSEHPTTANRYSNLALVLRDLGDYAGAKALLEKALISDEKNFGSEHPSTARNYSNLALVLQDLGDYAGAKELLEKALISDEKNFGSEHPNTAIRYSNLAMVLKDLGDYAGAKALLEKALISDEKNFGSEHPSTAINKWNLASVLVDLNQLEEAHILFTQAYATFVLRLGEEHPDTKGCLSWLNHVKGLLGG
jgi:tetratricopeptide (TPR) repeat protein